MKQTKRFRTFVQLAVTALTNGYLIGFLKGSIYTGKTKVFCVPGLNCYSCPGAIASCPIGALQSVLGGSRHNMSYYVIGILLLFGTIFGRLICGFLCPFGFLQDLLYKIKIPKRALPPRLDKLLRYLKYILLVVTVILLPIFLTNAFGMAPPYFCQWICPAGTLEGGIPLIAANKSLQAGLGFLFGWKFFLLILTLLSSIVIYRPFCKYICPLGAFYSLFQRFSIYQMEVDQSKCNGCKICEKKCNMNVSILKNINSLECIRCGECIHTCPQNAISSIFLSVKAQKNSLHKDENKSKI